MKWHWSPTSAACAAPASPTTRRNNRQTRREQKSKAETRTGLLRLRCGPSDSPSGRRLRLKIRMHDCPVAREQRRLDQLVIPIDRELFLFLIDQGLDEREKIFGVERRSRSCEAPWNVQVADDLHAANLRHFAGAHPLDIAAA